MAVSSASASHRQDGVAFCWRSSDIMPRRCSPSRWPPWTLTPPHAGILRAIATEPGRSQQALSAQLGMLPSRVVVYVDELEDRGYVERRRNPDDRRLHALHLSAAGKRLMRKISELARQHETQLTAALERR